MGLNELSKLALIGPVRLLTNSRVFMLYFKCTGSQTLLKGLGYHDINHTAVTS